MVDLLSLTRAAAEGRGTTRVIRGIEIARAVDGDTLSVSLGPTDSWEDLLRSLTCKPVPWPGKWGGMVHLGYVEAARECFAHLFGYGKGKRLRFAGASMGGSVARLLAHLFAESGAHVVWLETYGEPGCQYGEPRALPGHRYVCGSDPFPWWSPGFQHHEEPKTLKSPNGPWTPIRGLLDHRLSSYERALT